MITISKLFSGKYKTRNEFPDEKEAGRLADEYQKWADKLKIGSTFTVGLSPRVIHIDINFRYGSTKNTATKQYREDLLTNAKGKLLELLGPIETVSEAS